VTVTGRSGPIVFVGQPHSPNLVIAQATGPALITGSDGLRIEARWTSFEGSRRAQGAAFERLSAVTRGLVVTMTQPDGSSGSLRAENGELHVRRHPTRFQTEGAFDISLDLRQIVNGSLDQLLNDANPSNAEIALTVTNGLLAASGTGVEGMERWRQAAGRVEMTKFALVKGVKRIEATGQLSIDDQRRPAFRIEPSIANIDQIAGMSLRGGLMDMAGALSGRPRAPAPDGLRPLPALELRDGRLSFGPIRLPASPIPPLY
jgi:hypothetical protein